MPREALSPIINTPHTPARRLSSKFVSPSTSRQVGLSSPGSVLTSFADDDEGQQRKQLRRRSQGFELHRKNLGSPRSTSPWATDSSLNGLTSTELASNYSDCIKLSAENKITAKNAFGLHLIDYMTVLLKKKELENFQVASSTLDASVKIYAGRVDFIHNHAYKVLSGLGGTQKAGDDDNHEDGEVGREGEPTAVKKKKKTRKGHTTETNLKNINVDKVDLAFEVDPMFQIMSAAFDEGGAKGLLLNRLSFYDNSQHLVLDSSTPVNLVESRLQNSQDSRKPVDVAAVQEMLDNLQLDKEICPSMSDFQFTNWNGESSDLPSASSLSEYAFDPSSEPQHLPSVEEEAEAIAHEHIDDLDNVADDQEVSAGLIDGISSSDSGTAEFVQSAFTDLSSGNSSKLRQILALEPTDYSYFNKILMGSWAGPAHWNVAAGKRTRPAGSSKSTAQTKRTRKAPLRLTYDTDGNEMDKQFTFSKATSLTKQTWSKYSKKKTTLPDDQQLDTQDRLFKLFHKPSITIKRQLNTTVGDSDDIENYDYNNKNDMENFCPVVRDDYDDVDNSSEGLDWSNERLGSPSSQMSQNSMSDLGLNGTIFTQDKLVAAPNKVQKIDIRYAKAAKRVDVKKLKTTMWSILATDSVSNDTRVPVPQQETVPPIMANTQTFSYLKDVIPVNVPSSMAKNLTIQTIFACLLYLTNEKTLKLSGSEGMDDIHIQQDDSL